MNAGETSGAVIEARGLCKRFAKFEAVSDLDLQVRRGEVLGVLGPNGAGKSTLIRMLTGLLSPSAGAVSTLGFRMPREAEKLKYHVGYMTQRFSLYEDLSVQENLEFAGEIFGLDRAERRRRVEEAMAEYELAGRRHQRTGSFSGGWKQRLALAVATLHRPELLFLDEPTAGVDPDRRRTFWEKIFQLAAAGTTVIVSTHYMDEAVRCHRLALLRDGRLAALGSPAQLTEKIAGRIVELQAPEPDAARRVLKQAPDVASVTQLGHRVHVLLAAGGPTAQQAVPVLAGLLESAGLRDLSLAPAQPGLEDVFVALTLGERFPDGRGADA